MNSPRSRKSTSASRNAESPSPTSKPELVENATYPPSLNVAFFHGVPPPRRPKFAVSESTSCANLKKLINLPVLFLILLSVVVAASAIGVDILISLILRGFYSLITIFPGQPAIPWVLYILLTVSGLLISILVVAAINPAATGSGVPEMRVILSGVYVMHYLDPSILIAKFVSVILCAGSGLFIGREGPFVHISCLIANWMRKFPPFRNMAMNIAAKQRILTAACALGLAVDYGSSIGGVLFSIEVTSTYYAVEDYGNSFICAIIGGLAFRLFHNLYFRNPIFAPLLPYVGVASTSLFDLVIALAIGVGAALYTAAFIWLHAGLVAALKRLTPPVERKLHFYLFRCGWGIIVAVITAVIRYPTVIGAFMSMSTSTGISDLFGISVASLDRGWNGFSSLFAYSLGFTFLLLLSISLPVPFGVFTPILAIGAGWGRIIGESLLVGFPNNAPGAGPIEPEGYAVVMAAAMMGGLTHAYSSAVLVSELTGQVGLLPAQLVAVLIAVNLSKRLSVSIFDSFLIQRRLPYLPVPQGDTLHLTAADIMDRNVACVPRHCSKQFLRQLLMVPTHTSMFAVVESLSSKTVLGTVSRFELLALAAMEMSRVSQAATEIDSDNELDVALARIRERYQFPTRFSTLSVETTTSAGAISHITAPRIVSSASLATPLAPLSSVEHPPPPVSVLSLGDSAVTPIAETERISLAMTDLDAANEIASAAAAAVAQVQADELQALSPVVSPAASPRVSVPDAPVLTSSPVSDDLADMRFTEDPAPRISFDIAGEIESPVQSSAEPGMVELMEIAMSMPHSPVPPSSATAAGVHTTDEDVPRLSIVSFRSTRSDGTAAHSVHPDDGHMVEIPATAAITLPDLR
eukprot:TRINITY_DN11367_c0_g1_i1.p1 TRINITY_DN11367_c0_g1~~TRINITY_DN11367_c0_g1_i1.p1  ORF type:complete len:864 (-),score=133.44 TRINITY_DN11367_c0_g1_i1:66-2657(-)